MSASCQALTPLAIAAELLLHGNRGKGRFSVMSFRCLLRAQLSDPEDFVGVFRRCSSQSSVCVQGEHKVFVEMPRRLGSERTVHAARIKDKVSQVSNIQVALHVRYSGNCTIIE